MAQVYECKMSITVTFDIRANSAEEAQDWLNSHSIEDLKEMTSAYDIEYDDQVLGEIDEAFYGFQGIDISG